MRGRTPRPWVGATVAGLLLLGSTAAGVQAGKAVLIELQIDFDSGLETFTTDSPLLCPEGEATSDFHFGAGNFGAAGTFHLNKLLVCDDGSGSFVIRVDAAANFVVGAGTTGGWSVVPGSGTGDYVGLVGGGHVVGVNQTGGGPVDLIDYYSGRVGF
jgi:hypothetical protein